MENAKHKGCCPGFVAVEYAERPPGTRLHHSKAGITAVLGTIIFCCLGNLSSSEFLRKVHFEKVGNIRRWYVNRNVEQRFVS